MPPRRGALTAVAAAAALALLPPTARARVLPPPWPYDGFDRFPALWFGANATGLDAAPTLGLIGRHALAGYGWQQGTATTNFRHCEAQGAAAAVHLGDYLAGHPPAPPATAPTALFVYRHFQMAWTFFDVTRAAALDAAWDGAMLHDHDGTGATCRQPVGNTTTPTTSPLFGWLNASAGDFWVDNVVSELASEAGLGVSAAFFDETDWSYCGYNFAKTGCTSLSDGYLEAEYATKYGVLRRTATTLNAAGVWPLFSSKNLFNASFDGLSGAKRPCLMPWDAYVAALDGTGYLRFEEFWVSTGNADLDSAQIDTANRAVALGMGYVARAQADAAGACPGARSGAADVAEALSRGATRAGAGAAGVPLSYALASFLLIQGPHTYFGYSTGWYDADWCWRPEYDALYGAPLAPAVRLGPHTWARNFTRCAVAVDTSTRTGTVTMHAAPVPPLEA